MAWAQVLPAAPGALLGIPLGVGLFMVANAGAVVTIPPVWWLVLAVLGGLTADGRDGQHPGPDGLPHPGPAGPSRPEPPDPAAAAAPQVLQAGTA